MAKGRIAQLAIMAIFALVFTALPSRPASAEQNTCTTRANRWAGWQNLYDPGNKAPRSGVRANISVYRGAVCNTDQSQNNFSTAWVFLRAPLGFPSPVGYVQGGYFRWYNSAIYTFAEYRVGGQSTFNRFLFTGPAIGSQPDYLVYVASDSHIYVYAGGSRLLRTPGDYIDTLESGFDIGPDFPLQWLSETTYAQSDIPGTPTQETRYSHMRQGKFNVGWLTGEPDTSINSNPSRWTFTGISDSGTYGRNYLSWTYANV